jgi:hypothetical protein
MIWDCFTINDELELLEARCREFERSDMEYTHVLVEGYETHRGKKKPAHYDEARAYFSDWPIVGWPVHLPGGEGDEANWNRERHQRDLLGGVLKVFAKSGHVAPTDLVIVSDVDEIPSADALPRIAEAVSEGPVRLCEPLYYYSLDWEVYRDGQTVIWDHSVAFLWRDRPASFSALRNDHGRPMPKVPDAGWHFSWFGSGADRVKKLRDFAHSELDIPKNQGLLRTWNAEVNDRWDGTVLDALGSPLVRSRRPLPDTITEVLGHPYERDPSRYARQRAAP